MSMTKITLKSIKFYEETPTGTFIECRFVDTKSEKLGNNTYEWDKSISLSVDQDGVNDELLSRLAHNVNRIMHATKLTHVTNGKVVTEPTPNA